MVDETNTATFRTQIMETPTNWRLFVLNILGWVSIAFIFLAIYGKDIISFYLLDYSQRNIYGAIVLLAGCVLAVPVAVANYRMEIFQLLFRPLFIGWLILLLLVAPFTAYFTNDFLFVSPHAVAFVAAIACFLVSTRILKSILVVTLVLQFVALLFEYHNGMSLTLTANEAKGIYFQDYSWLINPDIGLIRAKGLFDSTHDSTWLFVYSAFVFNFQFVILVAMCLAAWMAQGRLGIAAAGCLVFVGPRPFRTITILVVAGLLAIAVYPDKVVGGIKFFINGFNPQSASNTYRMEAMRDALDHLAKPEDATGEGAASSTSPSSSKSASGPKSGSGEQVSSGPESTGAWLFRVVFGASGSALGLGKVTAEMDYMLFAIEYGLLGLALMAWTIVSVFLDGVRSKRRLNIAFGMLMPVLMVSSSLQSVSSFFAFLIAVNALSPSLFSLRKEDGAEERGAVAIPARQ